MTRPVKPPHVPHPLHALDRHWPETNCYVDLWIELLALKGHDPVAALGFTVRQDFEGDQFTFFKMPNADLERLFGVTIHELAIFDQVEGHVREQISRSAIPLVEMDSYYLPDTEGLTYRQEHSKTTVAILAIDPCARTMRYAHNAGVFSLSGEDYEGIFGNLPSQKAQGDRLFPYAEFARFKAPVSTRTLADEAAALLLHHMSHRPRTNPVEGYRMAFPAHAEWLAARGSAFFHPYAFNTLRQMGANFELLADHLEWLGREKIIDFTNEIEAARMLAGGAKAFQFQLARALARGKLAGLESQLTPMVDAYEAVFAGLRAKLLRGLG